MRWAEQQRMDFIAERLKTEGCLVRADLTAKFGISVPQASIDIRKFRSLNPRAMTYDAKVKCYVARKSTNGTGRDTTEAADKMMRANDAELEMILRCDPDMIRDVAAALIYERTAAR